MKKLAIEASWQFSILKPCPPNIQAEREAYDQKMEEKHTKALLKNALDPLLSRLTKVGNLGYKSIKTISLHTSVFWISLTVIKIRTQFMGCSSISGGAVDQALGVRFN